MSPELEAALGIFYEKTRARGDALRAFLSNRFKPQLDQIDSETKARLADNDVARFAHPAVRLLVFCLALGVFLLLIRFTAAPRGIFAALKTYPHQFVPEAEACFGVGCLEDSKAPALPITLPKTTFRDLHPPKNRDLFYRIRINRSQETLRQGLDTLFLPIPWGVAQIYRSGVLVRSGMNIQPVIPLLNPKEEIVVHVSETQIRTLGFGPLYAPFLTDSRSAGAIETELAGEPFQVQYSFIAQMAGFCLLLVMYLSFPYRPELFAFLVLFGVETLRAYFKQGRNFGVSALPIQLNVLLYEAFVVIGAISIVFFVSLFFRRHLAAVWKQFQNHSISFALLLSGSYVLLTSLFKTLSTENAIFIASWGAAFLVSLLVARWGLLKLFVDRLHARFAMGVVTLLGVYYWAFLNISDHFVLDSRITTESRNHLHFFFYMATILGIEVGRTEVKLKGALSLLSKEAVSLFHTNRSEWHQGFVVLIDVVAWSDKLLRLNLEETEDFMRAINGYLLSHFEQEPEASIINDRGDGFFLTFKGSAEKETFSRISEACRKLALNRPGCAELGIAAEALRNEAVIVRSALAYGPYKLELSRAKNLRRDFIAGFLPTLLARVIGNEPDPKGPRVLMSHKKCGCSPLDNFRGGHESRTQVTKGLETDFWEYS